MANSDVQPLILLQYYFTKEDKQILLPLLNLDGGRKADIKYYIEVFVKPDKPDVDYEIRVEVGYPGLLVIKQMS